MQAITTKYMPATNTRGSKIKATTGSGKSITIPYPHEYDGESAHREAAIQLIKKMGWDRKDTDWKLIGIISGGTKDGYCHVLIHSTDPARIARGDFAYPDPDRRR